MAEEPNVEAWNNFVMVSEPNFYDVGSEKWSAAVTNQYWGLALNGGVDHFLCVMHDIDANDIREALNATGALVAAKEFGEFLNLIGERLSASSQNERSKLLDRCYTEPLDEYVTLTIEADTDLASALKQHVIENEDFYLNLNSVVSIHTGKFLARLRAGKTK